MSLDRTKLQKLRELRNGTCHARCPACAEAGQDRKGEHLRISPEGKFGCCVFPGDREHRKRIFALAGEHGPKEIRVRVATATAATPVREGIFGRLGRAVRAAAERDNRSDGPDGATAVQGELEEIRTARTLEMESEEDLTDESRTARTGSSLVTRNANEINSFSKLKEFGDPVRSVRTEKMIL